MIARRLRARRASRWSVIAFIATGCADAKPPQPPAIRVESAPVSLPSATAAESPPPRGECTPTTPAGLQARCDRGELASCAELAGMFQWGSGGVTADLERARSLAQRACDGGSARGCDQLALLYRQEQAPLPPNTTIDAFERRVLAMYDAECARGDAFACDHLRSAYEHGTPPIGTPDGDKAADYRRRATDLYRAECARGVADACTHHGLLVEHDEAAASLSRGCDGGDAWACYLLGWSHYRLGDGVPKDAVRARQLVERACRCGQDEACAAAQKLEPAVP